MLYDSHREELKAAVRRDNETKISIRISENSSLTEDSIIVLSVSLLFLHGTQNIEQLKFNVRLLSWSLAN